MSSIVLGAQWGDEGKGKIVDVLSSHFNWVIRFSGGANAGHTIVNKGVKYVFHLLPSGILHKNTQVLLGPATVIDPEQLFYELEQLSNANIDWKGRIFISDRAHLILPSYKKEDKKLEEKRVYKIGTTQKGIGIAYAKKMLRTGIRIADMHDPAIIRMLSKRDRAFVKKYASFLSSIAVNHYYILQNFTTTDKILFEGAQGVLLDSDYGTYPYVTSGPTGINGVTTTGFPIKQAKKIIGVAKAYSTRVGEGPFPTEYRKDEAQLLSLIQTRGNEKGSTTGRLRRCGHLDLISLKYACKVSCINSLILTHVDVLDVFDTIKVCVGYEIENDFYDYTPSSKADMEAIHPVMRNFAGWKVDTSNIRKWEHLPNNALSFISFLESYLEVPIDAVSVGADRDQMIFKDYHTFTDNL